MGPLSLVLERSLQRDPLYPILTKSHLEGVDRRHAAVMSTVEECIKRKGYSTVIINSLE